MISFGNWLQLCCFNQLKSACPAVNNLDSRCEISYTPTLISCLHLVRPISWTCIHLCDGARGPPPLTLINKTLFMPFHPPADCRITRREIKWLSGPVPAAESQRSSLFTSAVTWTDEWRMQPIVTPWVWWQHGQETVKSRPSSCCCWADARDQLVISSLSDVMLTIMYGGAFDWCCNTRAARGTLYNHNHFSALGWQSRVTVCALRPGHAVSRD